MAGDIFAGLSAIKTAFDMAKGLEGIHETVARDRAVIDLQKEILAAQSAQAQLVEAVGALKSRVAELEAWDAEKQRYELVALAPNVMAYAAKNAMRGNEPPHYICANCYQIGRKSFLNQFVRGDRYDRFRCGNCSEELTINKGDGPRSALPDHRRGGGPDGWMNR